MKNEFKRRNELYKIKKIKEMLSNSKELIISKICFSEEADLKFVLKELKEQKFIIVINIENDEFINITYIRPKYIDECVYCKKIVRSGIGNGYTTINSKPAHFHKKCWKELKPKLKYNEKKQTYED